MKKSIAIVSIAFSFFASDYASAKCSKVCTFQHLFRLKDYINSAVSKVKDAKDPQAACGQVEVINNLLSLANDEVSRNRGKVAKDVRSEITLAYHGFSRDNNSKLRKLCNGNPNLATVQRQVADAAKNSFSRIESALNGWEEGLNKKGGKIKSSRSPKEHF